MPIGLIAGWNFDLNQGDVITSYVGSNFDFKLPQEYN